MTTLAILADIHGNVPALEAVLSDLETVEIDEVLVGGDLVGRGPQGTEVVRRIAGRSWPSVRGNHEDYLLDFRRRRVPDSWWHEDVWAASRWMEAELDEEAERWIAGLPLQLRSQTAPGLQLVHGTTSSNNRGLGPWTSTEALEQELVVAHGRVLVCAHTHRPMVRDTRRGIVVNVGSVGLPFNRDRRAQYALFHYSDGEWRVELRQVEYDVERALEIHHESGFAREGGITARLLAIELQEAAPFLVPFLAWCEAAGRTPEEAAVPEFLDLYDPDVPTGEFFRRLRATSKSAAG